MTERVVRVTETGEGKFREAIDVGGRFSLTADEPEDLGGTDAGPDPYEFLLAGLGACKAMTLRMYADHKGIPLTRVSVTLRHDKIHAHDCETCETEKGMLDRIAVEIDVEGDFDEATRARLLEIADRCPVHRTLTSEVVIESRLADGS